jgi:hypothetical protein
VVLEPPSGGSFLFGEIMKSVVLMLCLFAGSVRAESKPYDEWEQQDKVQFATFTTLAVIDYQQTSWGMKQKDEQGNYLYSEANPLLGSRPSDTKLAVAQLIGVSYMYYDIKKYGDKHRTARWFLIALKAATVINNNHIGLTITKVF